LREGKRRGSYRIITWKTIKSLHKRTLRLDEDRLLTRKLTWELALELAREIAWNRTLAGGIVHL